MRRDGSSGVTSPLCWCASALNLNSFSSPCQLCLRSVPDLSNKRFSHGLVGIVRIDVPVSEGVYASRHGQIGLDSVALFTRSQCFPASVLPLEAEGGAIVDSDLILDDNTEKRTSILLTYKDVRNV